MTKMSYDGFNALKDVLRKGTFNSTITIECMDGFKSRFTDPITWAVNWSALGAQMPEFAEEFGRMLCKVAELTEHLNSLEIIIGDDADTIIDSAAAYRAALDDIKAAIRDGNLTAELLERL